MMVTKVGALNDAATVSPCWVETEAIVPEIGERMVRYGRSLSTTVRSLRDFSRRALRRVEIGFQIFSLLAWDQPLREQLPGSRQLALQLRERRPVHLNLRAGLCNARIQPPRFYFGDDGVFFNVRAYGNVEPGHYP